MRKGGATAPLALRSAPVTVESHPGGMPHIRSTIATMCRLAKAAQGTFPVRNLATRITRHVPSKNPPAELRALYNWVREHVRYRYDPVELEWVQSPERTLKELAGDCDDIATLLAALAGSLGHRWQFRTVGKAPNAPQHVQVQAWDGKQWVDLDPVLEPTRNTTAPRSDAGTFALAAAGHEQIWNSEGKQMTRKNRRARGLSGPTSAQDRKLWSIVPYFAPAPPWGPYGGIQPPTPGKFPRIDTAYRSPDAPGFEDGKPYSQVFDLPPGSVFSEAKGDVAGLGLTPRTHRAGVTLARTRWDGPRKTSRHAARILAYARHGLEGVAGPTTAAERELWHWIPYDPTGNMAGLPGVVLSLPVAHMARHMRRTPPNALGLIPFTHPLLGAGLIKKLKKKVKKVVKKVGNVKPIKKVTQLKVVKKAANVAKKTAKVAKKIVKSPAFQATALTIAQAVPGAGQAALVAKGAAVAAKAIKAAKNAKGLVKDVKAAAKSAKAKGATSLVAALPAGKDDWKKPHANLRRRYPQNARQLFDKRAGVFRVFVPSKGLTPATIKALRAKGGKAKPKALHGLGALRPTISFSLGAVASTPSAARTPAIVAAAEKAVKAVYAFRSSHSNQSPQIALPAVTAFQTAEGNLKVDGLYGRNTIAALEWYLQGTGIVPPPVSTAPKFRATPITWTPPIATLPAAAATPQPRPPAPKPVASAAPKPAPAPAKPKPPAAASFPAPAGYTEIGAESANPGLTPAGYTAPGAPAPAPAVSGTPRQPGAPTGGAPQPPVASAVAEAVGSGALKPGAITAPTGGASLVQVDDQGDEDDASDDGANDYTRSGTPVDVDVPVNAYLPPPSMTPALPRLPVTTGPVPLVSAVVAPGSPTPVMPPGMPVPTLVPSSSSSSSAPDGVLWAALALLYLHGRTRAA